MKIRVSFLMVWVALWLGVCGCAATPSASDKVLAQMQTQGGSKAFLPEAALGGMKQSTLTSYKDYVVGPEDLLEVTFFGMDDLTRETRVNGQGEIVLPLAGSVPVGGLTPAEIETRLAKVYKEGRFIRDPQVTVFIKEYRFQRVMVTGAVITPGSYEVIGPRSLLEMLGKAGGLNDKAGDKLYLIRYQSASAVAKSLKKLPAEPFAPGTETIIIDLHRLLIDSAMELNLPVKSGDVIHVPPARMAFVLGSVKKTGQVPVKENLTVTQALALTEGLDPLLASNNVTILRFDDQGQRITIPVHLGQVTAGKAPDPLVKPNDVIIVAESLYKRFLYNIRNLMPGSIGVSAAAL